MIPLHPYRKDHLERLKQWEDLVSLDKLLQLSLELTLGHKVLSVANCFFRINLVLKVPLPFLKASCCELNYTETIKCIGCICCGKPFCLTWIIKANVLECKERSSSSKQVTCASVSLSHAVPQRILSIRSKAACFNIKLPTKSIIHSKRLTLDDNSPAMNNWREVPASLWTFPLLLSPSKSLISSYLIIEVPAETGGCQASSVNWYSHNNQQWHSPVLSHNN